MHEALEGSDFEAVANLRGGFLQARLNGFDAYAANQLSVPAVTASDLS